MLGFSGEGCVSSFLFFLFSQKMDWSNETHFEDTVQSRNSNMFLSYHINIAGFRHVDKERTNTIATPLSVSQITFCGILFCDSMYSLSSPGKVAGLW